MENPTNMPVDQKTCRHCGNSDHYSKEVTAGEGMLPIGALHGPKYQIVVCGACGLTEWFVPARFLHLVKEGFDPVQRPT